MPPARPLDAASRLQLRILATHLVIILAFAVPSLLYQPWHSLFAHLSVTFRLAAASLAVMALLGRQGWPRGSFCLWDEVAALSALALLSQVLARQTFTA